jgi:hypothetical protein
MKNFVFFKFILYGDFVRFFVILFIVLKTACSARGSEPELAKACRLFCLSPILGERQATRFTGSS